MIILANEQREPTTQTFTHARTPRQTGGGEERRGGEGGRKGGGEGKSGIRGERSRGLAGRRALMSRVAHSV